MKNVEIIVIPVTDQQKAKQFYLKLGFEIIVEAPSAHGQTWIQLGLPGKDTSIALMNFHGIIFETDDIDQEIEELKTKAIEMDRMDTTPWGRFAWMKDLDGNALCLHQK